MKPLRIGIHTSSGGTLEKTALRAVELQCDTFQIFSASPRMWRAAPPDPGDCRAAALVRERHGLFPLVIHDSYLINLASIEPEIRAKSIAAFRGEVERAEAIGAEFLVAHPGSYKNQTLEEGIESMVEGLLEAVKTVRNPKVMLLLEGTAGAGNSIGGRFEDLRAIRDLAQPRTDLAIGYCLDTCHLLAAGYDIATAKGLEETLAQADRILGLDNIRVVHANDSKAGLGSHLDRHENIGQGHIGEEGFRRILKQPELRDKPFILETPIDQEGDDRRNLETIRRLCPKSRTTTKKSS